MTSENVSELRENIFHGEISAESTATTGSTAYACVTVLVVTLTFFAVTQHFIRFSSFLEMLLRVLVSWILVGVKLDGKLAVGALEFILTGTCLLYTSDAADE